MKSIRKLLLVLMAALVFFLLPQKELKAWEKTYEDIVRYYAPCWVDDTTIGFLKEVRNERIDKDYPWWVSMMALSTGGRITLKVDYYLCTMKIDGTAKTELAKLPKGFYPENLSWGKKLIVLSGGMRAKKSKEYRGHIATVNNDGKDFKVIGEGKEATLSPDETKILYVEQQREKKVFKWQGVDKEYVEERIEYVNTGLWQMDTAGNNKVQLTDNPGDSHPLWSPDGTMVAFLRSEAVAHAELLIYDFKKKEDRKIIESVGFEGWDSTQNLLWVSSGGRQSKIDYEYYVDLSKIDLNGDIVEKLWSIRALQRTFSPDRKLAVGVYRDNQFYVSDEKIQVMYLIKNYQTIEHGRHNRKQKNNVWIKE